MPEIGYFLSSEEHGPTKLVRFAELGEAAGFRSLTLSDHSSERRSMDCSSAA